MRRTPLNLSSYNDERQRPGYLGSRVARVELRVTTSIRWLWHKARITKQERAKCNTDTIACAHASTDARHALGQLTLRSAQDQALVAQ